MHSDDCCRMWCEKSLILWIESIAQPNKTTPKRETSKQWQTKYAFTIRFSVRYRFVSVWLNIVCKHQKLKLFCLIVLGARAPQESHPDQYDSRRNCGHQAGPKEAVSLKRNNLLKMCFCIICVLSNIQKCCTSHRLPERQPLSEMPRIRSLELRVQSQTQVCPSLIPQQGPQSKDLGNDCNTCWRRIDRQIESHQTKEEPQRGSSVEQQQQ